MPLSTELLDVLQGDWAEYAITRYTQQILEDLCGLFTAAHDAKIKIVKGKVTWYLPASVLHPVVCVIDGCCLCNRKIRDIEVGVGALGNAEVGLPAWVLRVIDVAAFLLDDKRYTKRSCTVHYCHPL